ncbi:MAG TPA: NAD(P)/FAD-dependent oxidoreductase [Gemmatimonadaceae bacterium]|nr:NAD(P)/FAD-dependent oxidoreductase [Gemmatimonadaceae bacterium]
MPNDRDDRARRPRVVIVGGGFAGLSAAKVLGKAPVDVTVVDVTNHHLFQPLLYQVATATLAPSDITVPIRWVLRKHENTTVLMAAARRVDVERRVVVIDEGRELPYDYLILATGARHSYFGHEDWEVVAPGLKSIADAYDMRRRFLLAFEEAEKATDPAERAALQTFVIVGGGPTGVELAGIIPDTATKALQHDFRNIDTRATRTILLEGGPRILPAFPEELSAKAARDLAALGVDVRVNSVVTRIDEDAVYVGAERIPTRTVFWAAGNAASPLGRSLGAPVDRAGRVVVEPDLSVPGHPELFVCGDLAAVRMDDAARADAPAARSWQGAASKDAPAPPAGPTAVAGGATSPPRFVPGVAPAANQMGALAARNVLRLMRGEPTLPFEYHDKGNLATIGRHRAIADFGRFRVTGRLAWWLWLFVHLLYLVGFRNRVSVLVQWAYSYFTYQRGVRLISGEMVRGSETAGRAAAAAAATQAGRAPVAAPAAPAGATTGGARREIGTIS